MNRMRRSFFFHFSLSFIFCLFLSCLFAYSIRFGRLIGCSVERCLRVHLALINSTHVMCVVFLLWRFFFHRRQYASTSAFYSVAQSFLYWLWSSWLMNYLMEQFPLRLAQFTDRINWLQWIEKYTFTFASVQLIEKMKTKFSSLSVNRILWSRTEERK